MTGTKDPVDPEKRVQETVFKMASGAWAKAAKRALHSRDDRGWHKRCSSKRRRPSYEPENKLSLLGFGSSRCWHCCRIRKLVAALAFSWSLHS